MMGVSVREGQMKGCWVRPKELNFYRFQRREGEIICSRMSVLIVSRSILHRHACFRCHGRSYVECSSM